jgi:hypothetical protein
MNGQIEYFNSEGKTSCYKKNKLKPELHTIYGKQEYLKKKIRVLIIR